MNLLIVLLLISFPLGHLTRLELANNVAIYFHDIVASLMFLSVLSKALRKKKLPTGKLLKPILLFSLVSSAALLIGIRLVSFEEALIGGLYLIRWLIYSAVYFAVLDFKTSQKYIKLFSKTYKLKEALLLSGYSLITFAWVQYLFVPNLTQLKWLGWDDHFYRLTGTILDPGFTGILIILTIFLALNVKIARSTRIIVLITSLLALLLTYSRASYLAFLISGSVYIITRKKFKLGLIALALFFISLPFLPRPGGEGVNLMRVYSALTRIESSKQALHIFKDHPIFGIGFNLLRFTKRNYGFLGDNWRINHAGAGVDNSYLFVLATTGVLGFLTFLFLLVKMLKPLLKPKLSLDKITVLSSLTAVSVHALFNNTWFYSWVLLWIWYLLGATESDYSS